MFHDDFSLSSPDITAYQSSDLAVLDTTLTEITDLSVDVVAGRQYVLRVVLYVRCLNTGIKASFSGTSTMTSFIAGATNKTFPYAQWTALDQSKNIVDNGSSSLLTIVIDGTFVPSGSGTLTVKAAESVSQSGSINVFQGSHMLLWRTV